MFLSITKLVLTVSRPLKAIDFVFCTAIQLKHNPLLFDLIYAHLSVGYLLCLLLWLGRLQITLLKVAGFFGSLIPVISWFCHLVLISSKYILNSVGERGQPWRTPLLISTGLDNLLLYFINILLRVSISISAFSNVSGIYQDFKMLNKVCLFMLSNTSS